MKKVFLFVLILFSFIQTASMAQISYDKSDFAPVYSVIDDEGEHYSIRRWGICNRFAFLVTDVDIIPADEELITDEEFIALNGKEDNCLATPFKDVSAECAALQREYEKNRDEIRRRYE